MIDTTPQPIVFDPRWAQSTNPKHGCKKECTPEKPCDGAVHGGYKMGRMVARWPQDAWPERVKTAVCLCCRCKAGNHDCDGTCACHGGQG